MTRYTMYTTMACVTVQAVRRQRIHMLVYALRQTCDDGACALRVLPVLQTTANVQAPLY